MKFILEYENMISTLNLKTSFNPLKIFIRREGEKRGREFKRRGDE